MVTTVIDGFKSKELAIMLLIIFFKVFCWKFTPTIFKIIRAKINLFFNPDTQRVGSDGEARRGGIPPGPLLLVVGGGEGRWADAGDSGHVLLRADQGGGGGEYGGAEGAGLHQAGADTRHHEEPGILPVRTRGLVWIF